MLQAAAARLTAGIAVCAPGSGAALKVQQQALDHAIYFLECAAAAVSTLVAPPPDASPARLATQSGAPLPAPPPAPLLHHAGISAGATTPCHRGPRSDHRVWQMCRHAGCDSYAAALRPAPVATCVVLAAEAGGL